MTFRFAVAVTAVVAAMSLTAGVASADKRCRSVHVVFPDGTAATAEIEISHGTVSCRTASRAVRRLVAGKGRYHEGGSSVDSYTEVAGGWRGEARGYAYGMTNTRTGVYIHGDIH